jgi:O-antigen/teichoic acid export membrane protein
VESTCRRSLSHHGADVTRTPAPPPGPLGATVLRNASVLGAATIVVRLLMFALGIVLARALGAESYGQYALALALGVVLQPVADLGLTPYLSREIARDRRGGEAVLPALLVAKVSLLGATFLLTAGVAALVVSGEELLAVIVAMVLAALLDGLSIFVYGYFQGREAMHYEARATAIAAGVRGAGGIVLALATDRLAYVVGWILLVAVLQAAAAAFRLRREVGEAATLRRARGASAAVNWRAVASMGLIAIFVMTYLRVDTVFLGWLQDERAAGLYAAAYALMMGAQIPPWMLATALTPVFARTYHRDPAEFEASWHRGLRLVLLISLPIALIASLLAGGIVDRLYGDEFERSADVLALVIWICPLGAVSLIAQAVLRGAGRELWLTVVSGGCAALNVGLNLWAIPRHGIMGAAVVTVVTEAVNMVALVAAARRGRLVPWPRFPVMRTALAACAASAVAIAGDGLPVEVAGLGAVAAYLTVLWTTGVLRR